MCARNYNCLLAFLHTAKNKCYLQTRCKNQNKQKNEQLESPGGWAHPRTAAALPLSLCRLYHYDYFSQNCHSLQLLPVYVFTCIHNSYSMPHLSLHTGGKP